MAIDYCAKSDKDILWLLRMMIKGFEIDRKRIREFQTLAKKADIWKTTSDEFRHIVFKYYDLSKTAKVDLEYVCDSIENKKITDTEIALIANLADYGKRYYHDICLCYDTRELSKIIEKNDKSDVTLLLDLIFVYCRSFFDDLQNFDNLIIRLEQYNRKMNTETNKNQTIQVGDVYAEPGSQVQIGTVRSKQQISSNSTFPFEEILKILISIENEIKLQDDQAKKLQEAIDETKKKKNPDKIKMILKALLSMASKAGADILAAAITKALGLIP